MSLRSGRDAHRHLQALAGDFERQHAASSFRNGGGNGLFSTFLDHKQNAASSAGAANFGRAAAVFFGGGDELVDQRRGNSWSVGAAQLPFFAEQAGDVFPILTQKGLVHVASYGDDLLEVAK